MYLLDDIMENLSQLFIVSNGFLKEESIEKLKKYTNDILLRSNEGFDSGAWRDVMVRELGFEKLEEFDEIILFNDSFFGPIYPFKEMFDVMDSKDIDFWGISVHGEAPNANNLSPYGYRPRYLQTYFLAFRKSIVSTKDFQDYWTNLPNYETFQELAFKHGAIFTKHFEDLGYKWESYVDTGDIECVREYSTSFHTYDMYNMVANRKLPVIKRKAFKLPRKHHLHYNFGLDLSSTMEYIEKNTSYDASLIYNYFLKTLDPGVLNDILNLNRIFPKFNPQNEEYETDKKVLAIAYLEYGEFNDYALSYLQNIPDYMDVLILTDTLENKEFFKNNLANKLSNKTDVEVIRLHKINIEKIEYNNTAAFMVECGEIIQNYDYLCLVHDLKPSTDGLITADAAYRDLLWENMLASKSYINSIVEEFDNDDNLGLIVPPLPYHGDYFKNFANRHWNKGIEDVKDLLKKMGMKENLSRNVSPLTIDTFFWIKTDALQPLFDLNLDYNDFYDGLPNNRTLSNAINRIYGYVAAQRGYYAKIVVTEEYARAEIFNNKTMTADTLTMIKSRAKSIHFINGFDTFIRDLRTVLNDYNMIRNSKSWKITKPLRFIRKVVKKLK